MNWPKRIRQWHLYLGTLFAPAIIFFSHTGAVQVLGLHEGRPGSSYEPPLWVEKLAQVHKKQTLATRPKNRPNTSGNPANRPKPSEGPQRPGGPPPAGVSMLLLKWFFVFTSLGLTFTTLLGIYMAFKYNRDRRLVWSLLIVGTVLPILLLLM